MDAITIATWALVFATLVLAGVAVLQLKQMINSSAEDIRQTEAFNKQAQLLAESRDVKIGRAHV